MMDSASLRNDPGALGDLFLKLETARQGPIKGESEDSVHAGEIILLGWSWGMDARTAMGTAGTSSKANVHEVVIQKAVDSASTAMMQVLRKNDVIKSALITQRKAGKNPHEYLKVTLQEGRLTSYQVKTDERDLMPIEMWSLSFKRISVEYRAQRADGLAGGTMTYDDVIA